MRFVDRSRSPTYPGLPRRSAVGGKAAVDLDGKFRATIRLQASSIHPRGINYAKTLSSFGRHNLKIVNVVTLN